MKLSKTIPFIVGLALVAPAANAGSKSKDHAAKAQRMLAKFDANGDSVLDAGELTSMIAAHQKRKQKRKSKRLARFDANGDGVLDASERKAAREARQKRRAARIAKLDTNGDGTVDASERKAAKRGRAGKRWTALVKRLDSDRDGALSWSELQPLANERPRLERRFRAADANRDGVVTKREFMQAARKMRGKRNRR